MKTVEEDGSMTIERDIGALLRDGSSWRIEARGEVASTMTEARRIAEEGCDGFTVVVAESQKGATGRLGRPWFSPSGGLWMTAVLRPSLVVERAPQLALAAAVSVAEALSDLGFAVGIKWPNDVLAVDAAHERRKLSGIRAEMALDGERMAWASLGIGLNVNNEAFPEALAARAVSLKELNGGCDVSRARCAATILDKLEKNLVLLEESALQEMRRSWLSYAVGLGERAVIRDIDGERCGVAVGMDAEGRLLLREEGKCVPTPIISGDLMLRV